VIAEVRDYRRAVDNSFDTQFVLLRPTMHVSHLQFYYFPFNSKVSQLYLLWYVVVLQKMTWSLIIFWESLYFDETVCLDAVGVIFIDALHPHKHSFHSLFSSTAWVIRHQKVKWQCLWCCNHGRAIVWVLPIYLTNADWAPYGCQLSNEVNHLGLWVCQWAATIHITIYCYYSFQKLILILLYRRWWKAVHYYI